MKRNHFSKMLIVLYLLAATAGWAQSKLDFWLRDAIKNYEPAPSSGLKKTVSGIRIDLSSPQPTVDAVLQIRNGDFSFVAEYGGALRTVAGPYATARLPIRAINEIAARDAVTYIAPHPTLKPLNDVALAITMVDSAISLGYTGKNVLVGIIDTGIDVTHPAFLDSAGKTRILYLWDQTMAGSGTNAPYYDFGTEWTKPQIDAGLCTSVDTDGHGTHVAGSLAGHIINHDESIYHGGAIHANLIVVKGQVHLLDGINYIFEKARQLGKPAVINISLGSQLGPHDGNDPFTAARDYLTGPGRIIVQAAGNDGENRIHHNVDADSDSEDMRFTLSQSVDSLLFELWHDGARDVDIQIIGPGGVPNVTAPAGASGSVSTPNGNLTVDNASNGPEFYNGDKRIAVKLENNVAAGAWRFRLSAPQPTTVHAWMWSDNTAGYFAFDTNDNHYTLVNEACSRSSLVVGALVSRTRFRDANGDSMNWEDFLGPVGTVARFSSGGPTRDGRLKPDIVAPGGLVISAKSGNIPKSSLAFTDEFRSIGGRPDIWNVFQNYGMMGSSSSNPHAGSAVAAMFNLHPRLTLSKILDYLRRYAKTEALPWDYRAGYGLFTLEEFLKEVPRVTALKQISGNVLELAFNKALAGAANPGNYAIVGSSSNRAVIAATQQNNVVLLTLSGALIEGVRDGLRIANVEGFAEPAIIEIDKLGTLVQPDLVLTNYVWHAEDSPYYVTGTTQLPNGVTLTIEPGTVVKFLPDENGPAEFQIFGALRAQGTPKAPIIFTSLNESSPGEWSGFYFDADIPQTLLQYCRIMYANEAIVCLSDSLAIENSVIAHTKDIGVFAQDANITIKRTIVYETGGGAFQDGIQLSGSTALLENLTVHGSGRAGIASFSSAATIRNCIIVNNIRYGVFSDDGQNDAITYSDVWSNGADFANVAPGTGTISLDPMFMDAAAGDFHLLPESPCINAGDPASPPDPDGTRADMGALPYEPPPTAVELITFIAEVDNDAVTLRWSTASEKNNFGFEIQRSATTTAFTKIGFVEGAGTTTNRQDYVFVDKELAPGNYLYRLKQIDLDGTFVFLHEVTTSIGPPATFALHTNFPNPFNPATTISFDVPMTATIDLQVFDLNGHLVRTLLHEEREPGRHRLVWDGKNANGEGSASGIYLVRLKSGDFVKTIRATLMK